MFSWDGNGLGLGPFDTTKSSNRNPEKLAYEDKMRGGDEHVTWTVIRGDKWRTACPSEPRKGSKPGLI